MMKTSLCLPDVNMKLKRKLPEKSNSMRILCVGKVSTDKSTFIDTVMSILEGKRVNKATGGKTATPKEDNSPNTSKVVKYNLKTDTKTEIFIVDMPGYYDNGVVDIDKIKMIIEGHVKNKFKVVKYNLKTDKKTETFIVDMPGYYDNGVVDIDKIKIIIEGHVKNKFKFTKEAINNDSESYVKNPELKDRIHVVCIFLDNESVCNKVPAREKTMIKDLSEWMTDEGIPFVAIITKMDEFDSPVNVVHTHVKKNFGFVKSITFPVQNCVDEDDWVPDMEQPIINALGKILDVGQEYIEEYDDE